jgi:hypothetical protein
MNKKEMEVKITHLEHLFQNVIKYIDAYIKFKGDVSKFDEYIHGGNDDKKEV